MKKSVNRDKISLAVTWFGLETVLKKKVNVTSQKTITASDLINNVLRKCVFCKDSDTKEESISKKLILSLVLEVWTLYLENQISPEEAIPPWIDYSNPWIYMLQELHQILNLLT